MDKFVLKISDGCLYMQVAGVEDLATALKTCPIGCVKFHLRSGLNDFAEWVGKSLGKKDVAMKLREVKLNESNPEETRSKIIEILTPKPSTMVKAKKW